LQGRVAVVTGAGRGIGHAIARRLAALGATVVVTARSEDQLLALQGSITAAGQGRCIAVPADATCESDVARVMARAQAEGELAVLVNNAGGGALGPLVETAAADWRQTLDLNATSMFLYSREAVRCMVARGGGSIVNISSIAACRPTAGMSAYAASKFAARGLTQVMARELKKHGIRVYSLCPGAVNTELRRAAMPGEDVGRLMQPEDIAELVGFLVAGPGARLRELELEISF
jgi:NAD(P)-dependent dehydrogenase (short-subunit alcohol dehydrogenase family)